jgi:predicted PurR-regulated permease PerM
MTQAQLKSRTANAEPPHAKDPRTANSDRPTDSPAPVELPASLVLAEEEDVLEASIKAGSVAQIVIAAVAVLGLIYLAKTVLITFCVALLLAFVLEPLVRGLARLRAPRWLGSLIAVALLLGAAFAASYFFYARAVDFAQEMPRYSSRIREEIGKIRSNTQKIAQGTSSVLSSPDKNKPIPVEVQEAPLSHAIAQGSGTAVEVLLAATFVPFIVYFMLTWKDHAHASTVKLFPKEHRLAAFRTVGRISDMIRTFIFSNVLIGLMTSAISIAVFGYLHVQYFYFMGVISGFVSLVPYLGIFLAVLPPLAGGIGVLHKSGVIIVVLAVAGLHLIVMNVLYPKLVGRRMQLNPLAVTLGLLFWSWIWGAIGLLLAVPILGASKIICDHVDSLRGVGNWLGE